MAQAIKESGRGASKLFKKHQNPFGMKYRSEMNGVATSVRYTDWEGIEDDYCSFETFHDAVRGYWIFIDRNPYRGWRNYSSEADGYIRHIVFSGYLGGTSQQRENYVRSILRLKKEAQSLLDNAL
ncbi:hypothetical protein BKI51_02660 [Alphaproteobacteria bacterium AO1-B]|nr:hypothetical protein BKI51_02660 [Alphaproteobacteria bacterium AO1-B]